MVVLLVQQNGKSMFAQSFILQFVKISVTDARELSPLIFYRSISTYLEWPLKKNVRLSLKLLEIERFWKDRLDDSSNDSKKLLVDENRPAKYVLAMFPYPSGRLHIGHLRVYTISDVCASYYTLNGFDTIHPIGWDAFGLPAENAARQYKLDPAQWTAENINLMREQLKQMGIKFDWDREIFTCRPDYYKWTQWLFLRLYERGLVRRALSEVYWDPVDETVLAAEQVDSDGRSWRSGALVERRRLRHWLIDTPRYAKRLLDGLKALRFDWGEVAAIQANWIGKCDVFRFLLPIFDEVGKEKPYERFDLRVENPTDLYATDFLIVTEEHALAVEHQRRSSTQKFIGDLGFYLLDNTYVLNFVTGQRMPVVVVSRQLATRGEWRFCMHACVGRSKASAAFDALLTQRIGLSSASSASMASRCGNADLMSADEILRDAESKGYGGYQTSRILRDWVVSRQRAWGTPIPMCFLGDDNVAPVGEHRLPILLEQRGQPMEDVNMHGSSASNANSVLDTDTLDTFFDSSWYYLRFLDPHNADALADEGVLRARMPVDLYVGGVEHADLHLFFARFMAHFLHAELGLLPVAEPFRRLIPQGIVRGRTFRLGDAYVRSEDVVESPKGSGRYVERSSGSPVTQHFEKMSKSKHNGIDPMELVAADGLDLARLQLLGAAAPRQPINWGATQEADVRGLKRFLDRCAAIVNTYIESRLMGSDVLPSTTTPNKDIERYCKDQRNECIRTVSLAIDVVHTTALDRLHIFASALKKIDVKSAVKSVEFEKAVHSLVIMLQLFAPHTAAELWAALCSVSAKSSNLWRVDAFVTAQKWPAVDDDAIIDFLISADGYRLSEREYRHIIEPLDASKLFDLAKSKYFTKFFQLVLEKNVNIFDVELRKYPGLQVTLDLKVKNSDSPILASIFLEFVKKRKT